MHYGKQAGKINGERGKEGVTLNKSKRFHITGLISIQGTPYFLVITLSLLRQALSQRRNGPFFLYQFLSTCLNGRSYFNMMAKSEE